MSRDNKGRHIGMENDRKNERSVNIGSVLLQISITSVESGARITVFLTAINSRVLLRM